MKCLKCGSPIKWLPYVGGDDDPYPVHDDHSRANSGCKHAPFASKEKPAGDGKEGERRKGDEEIFSYVGNPEAKFYRRKSIGGAWRDKRNVEETLYHLHPATVQIRALQKAVKLKHGLLTRMTGAYERELTRADQAEAKIAELEEERDECTRVAQKYQEICRIRWERNKSLQAKIKELEEEIRVDDLESDALLDQVNSLQAKIKEVEVEARVYDLEATGMEKQIQSLEAQLAALNERAKMVLDHSQEGWRKYRVAEAQLAAAVEVMVIIKAELEGCGSNTEYAETSQRVIDEIHEALSSLPESKDKVLVDKGFQKEIDYQVQQAEDLKVKLAAVVGVLTALHATPNASSEFWEIVNTLDKTLSSLPESIKGKVLVDEERLKACENALANTQMDRDQAKSWSETLQAGNEWLREGIMNAMSNLGVPQKGYPEPVAVAWDYLKAALEEKK